MIHIEYSVDFTSYGANMYFKNIGPTQCTVSLSALQPTITVPGLFSSVFFDLFSASALLH